jgi:hypothetical protein
MHSVKRTEGKGNKDRRKENQPEKATTGSRCFSLGNPETTKPREGYRNRDTGEVDERVGEKRGTH